MTLLSAAAAIMNMDLSWAGENIHNGTPNFYPIFVLFFAGKVSGVGVQDLLLRLPFPTPETKLAEQKGFKKLSLGASNQRPPAELGV